MAWSKDEAETLRRLRVDERLPFSVISTRIPGKTRNSCIAKAHRMGLCGEVVPKSTRARRQRQRRQKEHTEVRVAKEAGKPTRPMARIFACEPEPFEVALGELIIPIEERRTVATLTNTCCRWPIGDPQHADFHFCGKTKVEGLPYCEFHARRAFQPPQPRRRVSVEPARAPIHASPGVRQPETVD